METFGLYLADIMINIRILAIVLAILAFVLLMGVYDNKDETEEKSFNTVVKALYFAILCFIAVAVLLPSKEFIHMLYGM